MNKLCVVAKNKNTYFIKRLIEEVGQSKIELFDPWSDFILPEADHYWARSTGIYHSDMDLLILGSLPQDQVTNPVKVLKRFRSKPQQYNWLEENNFPCLAWLPLKGTDLMTIEKFFRLYPNMVVKPLVGQGGWGIEAHTWESFQSFWKKKRNQKDEDYLIQPLMKDAQELRYFFSRGSDAIVLERTAKSGIVANFQREGEAVLATLPPEFQKMIDRLVIESEALYGAIDLFIKGDLIYILELNAVPGVEQLEKISGQNVVKRLLESSLNSRT